LIGAVANEAPELFTALVAQVPFVDVLTTMLDADLPLTVGEWEEWGNPAGRRGGLRADVLLLPLRQRHGPQSGRLESHLPEPPGHRRAQRSSGQLLGAGEVGGQNSRPLALDQVLLRTEMGAGHGGPSGRYDAWKEEALVYAFLLDALGMLPST
jgi:oligopeptidase B